MELIVINQEKLKIILTPDDMSEYNITPDQLDYNKVTTKHIIWNLLEKAQNEKGFDADMSKLYVQIYPSKDGGCEMYITKYSKSSFEKTKDYLKETRNNKHEPNCFLALNFDVLYTLCKRITEDKLRLNTVLYHNPDGSYILVIMQKNNLPKYLSKGENYYLIPNYLSEYGVVYPLTDSALYYMDEHYKKIAEGNAAEILSSI